MEVLPMQKFITRLNIEHFHRKLVDETDPANRQMVLRLLAEEEARLATLEADPPEDKKKSG